MIGRVDHVGIAVRSIEEAKGMYEALGLSIEAIEEVPAEGLVFDVRVHEAVAQEETDGVECGSVLRVIRKGYRMRDRLLRPANVVVAKAPEATGKHNGGEEA